MYLPKFIPDVMPDRAYAVSHPGWERREADGLEYLIYRENSRIRAIQVIAETQGVISVPFLKTCIREISGREDADSWVLEKRDDIVVAKGALRNKGEMVLYRKMPEGDIRGFVLSFY
jgi:flagellar FliL protein